MWILKLLPRKKISKWVGRLAFRKFPRSIQEQINLLYAKIFGVNLNEAEFPFYDYSSLGDFFIRRLKVGARPISDESLIHPCDSRITQRGIIHNSLLIQAKGVSYSLQGLTGVTDVHLKFEDGYFITYYLSPKDYHRVHSPASGFITGFQYVKGDLWPVNDWAIQNVPKLYTLNERIYVEIATEKGPVGVVFVGATNVGSIQLKFEKNFFTNWKLNSQYRKYDLPKEIKKGDELGLFKMGSTVIVLYSPEWKNILFNLNPSMKEELVTDPSQFCVVKMGQSAGFLNDTD